MNMKSSTPSAALVEQAEAWFVRVMDPDCPPQDRDAFERWRAADPAHAQAYADASALWARIAVLKDAPDIAPYAEAALEPPVGETMAAMRPAEWSFRPRHSVAVRRRRRWVLPVALAAGVLCAALGLQWRAFVAPPAQSYETAGVPRSFVLPDGSQVRLDLSTRITVRFSGKTRDIDLSHGRALFEVFHDSSKPFTVHVGSGQVTALGTRFQLQRDTDQIVVTLAEGAVAVSREAAGGASARRTHLAAGQQLAFSTASSAWTQRQVDTELVTSWSKGRLVFRGTPLAEAVAEINRYSPRKLRIADAGLGRLPLSGTFKLGDADSVAATLPAVLPVNTVEHADEVVISSR